MRRDQLVAQLLVGAVVEDRCGSGIAGRAGRGRRGCRAVGRARARRLSVISTSDGSSPGRDVDAGHRDARLPGGQRRAPRRAGSARGSATVFGLHQVPAQPAAERRPHHPLARLGVEDDPDRLAHLLGPVGVAQDARRAGRRRPGSASRARAGPASSCREHLRTLDARLPLEPAAKSGPAVLARRPSSRRSISGDVGERRQPWPSPSRVGAERPRDRVRQAQIERRRVEVDVADRRPHRRRRPRRRRARSRRRR